MNTAKYRDFNNVPKLRREQLKRNYKPNPRYIKRIAAKASIPLEIQKTNDDMIVEARLKYIEENEVSQLEFWLFDALLSWRCWVGRYFKNDFSSFLPHPKLIQKS